MTIRIALFAVSLIATGAAHAEGSSTARAAASNLQGQKAWDFLTASPSVSRREVPTTGSVAPRPRRAVDRTNR